jgi:hypothetical protein
MPKKPAAHLTVLVDEKQFKRIQKLTGPNALTSEEERTMRMRQGVSLGKNDRLARKDDGVATLRIQLDRLEIEAFRAMGHIYGLKSLPPARAPAALTAKATAQKDKIIRALKRK